MGFPVSGQMKVFERGDHLRAATVNRMGDNAAENLGIFPGAFDYGGRFPGGTVRIPSPQLSATKTTVYPPWWPYYTQGSGNFYANFYPGTVGGLVPSNMFTPLLLTASSKNYVYAQVTATGGVVTGCTLAVSTTYPTLASATSGNAPTSFNVPIAIFDLSGSTPAAFNLVGFGNIWCEPYVTVFDTINTGAPLTAPFTPWFNWQWGAGY